MNTLIVFLGLSGLFGGIKGCSGSTPKFQPGDCVFSTDEFAKESGSSPRRIIKVGEKEYLYEYYQGYKSTSFISIMDDYYKKVDDSKCEQEGY